jgi:GT2 family glycosyltransferase
MVGVGATPLPRVGIVILNWRRPAAILACLESVGGLAYPDYRVIVVDNGSNNGSTERIRRAFPTVALIENGRNLGFAAGCNVGLREALRQGAAYVLLLNDDTEIAPDALTRLVAAGESETGIGVLGPRIAYYDRPELIWSQGGLVDRYGAASHPGADERADRPAEAALDVDYVSGCALLAKRHVVERVGLLDERFFAYYEEAAWCARVRRAGYRVVVVPAARVWHKVSADQRGQSALYLYLMTRNRLLYLRSVGASIGVQTRTSLELLRTALSWSLRRRHRARRPLAPAVLRGLGDALRGRYGPPPADLLDSDP